MVPISPIANRNPKPPARSETGPPRWPLYLACSATLAALLVRRRRRSKVPMGLGVGSFVWVKGKWLSGTSLFMKYDVFLALKC